MDFAIYFWGPLKTSDFKVKFSVRNIHLVVFEMIARALGKTFLPQGAACAHTFGQWKAHSVVCSQICSS